MRSRSHSSRSEIRIHKGLANPTDRPTLHPIFFRDKDNHRNERTMGRQRREGSIETETKTFFSFSLSCPGITGKRALRSRGGGGGGARRLIQMTQDEALKLIVLPPHHPPLTRQPSFRVSRCSERRRRRRTRKRGKRRMHLSCKKTGPGSLAGRATGTGSKLARLTRFVSPLKGRILKVCEKERKMHFFREYL